MRVILTNGKLDRFGGSELWCLTMYKQLKRDHEVLVYCKDQGEIANYFDHITSDPQQVKDADVIIGAHWEQLRVLRGKAPIILVSHSPFLKQERLQRGASAYVAVSQEIADLERKHHFDPTVILNPIDTNIYYPKTKPRKKLTKVLYMAHDGGMAGGIIKEACDAYGIEYLSLDKPLIDLSGYINEADLCIGLGRCLMEAMACGRNVISGDWRSWMSGFEGGGFITPLKAYLYQYDNYSNRRDPKLLDKQKLLDYFSLYDHRLGEQLALMVQQHHSVDVIVKQFMDLYGQIPN